ncbi:chromosome segregation protein Spc25-domain-containing protein [Rhodocollybia butyracea]|uniref:Kinetochore protein SPC25 n=1 Tax=Rhodocollybia butyracea TaxID=206335 RepID=A0A9P5Q4G5_9AGAR|nr:chromosome segregation protein Spc25-domain-containing protein [Rhodocollybia butyracea]
MAHTFDLKATLSDPNPRIDLRISAYEESSQNFLKALNSYKNRSIAHITDKREKEAAEIKKLQDKTHKVETETNKCKVQEIELMNTLEREQAERKNAEIAVATFKRQITSLQERSATIQAQIDEYRALVSSLKRDKGKERSTLNSHSSNLAPELHAFENILACSIDGLEKEQLLISFRCVDVSDPDREFSFILDVSASNYKVLKTSPPLPSCPLLVDKLNTTGDIFAFIIQIRQEFYRLANGEDDPGLSSSI